MEIRRNLLDSQRTQVQQDQYQYFNSIQNHLSKVDFEIGDRFSSKIEQKVRNHLLAGNVQFEQNNVRHKIFQDQLHEKHLRDTEKEKQQLHNKLKGINFELEKLKHQRIENPFSVYSQPSLKVYMEEDDLKRQQKAQKFVSALNSKEREFKSDFSKKMKEERDRQKLKQLDLEEIQHEERLIEQSKKHERIKNHLREIKLKNETRLTEMMEFEENYFRQLDDKLDKLRLDRIHLKDKQVDHLRHTTGIKPMQSNAYIQQQQIVDNNNRRLISLSELTKTLKVERPLYQRMNKKYQQNLQKDHLEQQENYGNTIKINESVRDINLIEHQIKYKQKKLELRNKYEEKRLEKLKTLGLLDGKSLRIYHNSYVSKENQQIMLNESYEQKKTVQKQNHLKILNFMATVKKQHKVHIDKDKQMEALLHKDKLQDNKKYIIMLKRKNPKTLKISDSDIFNGPKKRSNQTDDYTFKKEFNGKGNLYLSQLPQIILDIQNQKLQDSQMLQGEYQIKRPLKSSQSEKMVKQIYETHNYLGEIEKKFHLDEVLKDQLNWQKIAPTSQSMQDSQPQHDKSNNLDTHLKGHQSVKFEHNNNNKVFDQTFTPKRKVNTKLNNQRKLDRLRVKSQVEKIQDITFRVDKKANQMEQIAHAKWTIQPLGSLQDQDDVDEMRIDAIQARLKILSINKKE